MSEPDNELKKALAENGSLDPQKDEELKKKAVDVFSARMRKVERLVWIWLILCIWLGFFAYLRFQSPSTTSTKALIGYAILLLVAYESTILVKLAYWILNVKLSLLKEIKQLRLERSLPADRDVPPRGRDSEAPLRSISRRERTAWQLGLVGIVVLTVVYFTPVIYWAVWGRQLRPKLTHQGYVTLAADGSGTSVAKTSYVNRDVVPMTSFRVRGMPDSGVRWLDSRGRELPFTVSTETGQRCHTITLIEPVMPGEQMTYRRVIDAPALATKAADLWTYRTDWSFGYRSNLYTETLKLPAGAEIVSVSPEPAKQFVLGKAPVLRFEATRDCNEPFAYTIQYRLPAELAGQAAEE